MISPNKKISVVASKLAIMPLAMEPRKTESMVLTNTLPRSRVVRSRLPRFRIGKITSASRSPSLARRLSVLVFSEKYPRVKPENNAEQQIKNKANKYSTKVAILECRQEMHLLS